MMSLPSPQPAKPVDKASPHQASKKPQPSTQSSSPGLKPPLQDQQQPQPQALKCPRCDSSNTKFCYYNNYSLSQPRHFCKTCRRYWTKGGAIQNIPVGGGSHKNKRLKSSYSSSKDFPGDIGDLKLFHGVSPGLDFQLGGFEVPKANPPNALTGRIYDSQFPTLGEGNPNSILGGLNFPLPMVIQPQKPPTPSSPVSLPSLGDLGLMKIDGNLASSIESLSCINQDLHWKLQQQRLAALYADNFPRDSEAPSSKQESFGGSVSGSHQENIVNGSNSAPPATEWFFGNSASYTSMTPSPTNSGSNGNENTSCNNWHRHSNNIQNNNNNNNNNSNGRAVIHHHQGWGARKFNSMLVCPKGRNSSRR